MINRLAFEAVDRTLRDITDRPHIPFGGLVVVFGGDVRQTLPVVPRAGHAATVAACIKQSRLWPSVTVLRLVENMRVQAHLTAGGDPVMAEQAAWFAHWLLDVGEGRGQAIGSADQDLPNLVIPECFLPPPGHEADVTAFVQFVYPNIANHIAADQRYGDTANGDAWLSERCILAPLNIHVDCINASVMDTLPGDPTEYLSADSPADPVVGEGFPIETLNTYRPSGFPCHRLKLKPGVPIILLRNLDAARGLCNGTRLVVVQCAQRVLYCHVLSGLGKGNFAHIPRIDLISNEDAQTPIRFKRR